MEEGQFAEGGEMRGRPDALPNDLIAIGESAARAFVRGTKKLKEQIEPMALGLAEARKRYLSDSKFGEWLKTSAYVELGRNDRAALIKLGEKWDDDIATRFAELDSYSPELIAKKLLSDNLKDEDEDVEGGDVNEDDDSRFYGSPRIARSNEAWDTIDPRLVKSLVEAIPALKDRVVWEPAAGCGMLVDQLRGAGVTVTAATDIEPRRDDIMQLDLLAVTAMPAGVDATITNPPWGRLAAPFVRHILKLAEDRKAMVAMLLPLPWVTGRKVADMTGSAFFEALVVPRYRARWMTAEEEAELKDGPSSPKMNHVWLAWDFARDPNLLSVIRFVDAPLDDVALDDDEEQQAAAE
jgi:hypothetical protein